MKAIVALIAGIPLIMLGGYGSAAQSQGTKGAPAIVNDACYMCHSEHGNNPHLAFVPRLAAQNATYIEEQLKAFRDGSRASPPATMYMWPLTQQLTESEMKGVAQWYASQPPPAPFPKDTSTYEQGRAIFEKGVLQSDVAACSSCHGTEAAGNGMFPRLAGQTPQYLLSQLRYFRSGARNDKRADIMKPIASHLTEAQMNAVAHYLSTL
jgi:cytochrome c553